MKILLSSIERKAFKAQAHALDPVVLIGNEGLTDAVIREIDRALKSHELIKIRAFTDERESRVTWFDEICDKLNAAPIQHIGKILVVWRHNPEKKIPQPAARPKKPKLTKKQAAAKTERRRRT